MNKVSGPAEVDFDKIRPIEIVVDGDFDFAVKKFKALFQKEKVIGRLKEKATYEKPSDKKRRKQKEAAERRYLTDMRERLMASGEWDRRQKKKVEKQLEKSEKKAKKEFGIEK